MRTNRLKAIIFDCDGVIADTEPLHFRALKKTLADEGIGLSQAEYYGEYLSFDDRGCFVKAFAKSAKDISGEKINELILRKAHYFEPILQENLQILPGVGEFIEAVASRYPLAIASGARRKEIDAILQSAHLEGFFRVIVSTEDVLNGKPHPESFLKACALLDPEGHLVIQPENCLVIEDSIHGVNAAHTAGMTCVAVTNSYARELLSSADLVVDSLGSLSLDSIASLFDQPDAS